MYPSVSPFRAYCCKEKKILHQAVLQNKQKLTVKWAFSFVWLSFFMSSLFLSFPSASFTFLASVFCLSFPMWSPTTLSLPLSASPFFLLISSLLLLLSLSPPISLPFSPQGHEFVDEQLFEQNCLEGALQPYRSRTPSVSSGDGLTGTCCTRRSKRNAPVPNASVPALGPHTQPHMLTHTLPQSPGLQELSAINIQCAQQKIHSSRSD